MTVFQMKNSTVNAVLFALTFFALPMGEVAAFDLGDLVDKAVDAVEEQQKADEREKQRQHEAEEREKQRQHEAAEHEKRREHEAAEQEKRRKEAQERQRQEAAEREKRQEEAREREQRGAAEREEQRQREAAEREKRLEEYRERQRQEAAEREKRQEEAIAKAAAAKAEALAKCAAKMESTDMPQEIYKKKILALYRGALYYESDFESFVCGILNGGTNVTFLPPPTGTTRYGFRLSNDLSVMGLRFGKLPNVDAWILIEATIDGKRERLSEQDARSLLLMLGS